MKKPAAKAKATTKMAPRMPNGTEIMDITNGSWKLGDAIGSGGFGLIYLTQKCPHSGPVSSKAEYVMKLEPHDSGPLFCELSFFQRATKQENVNAFKSSRGLKCLGLPNLIAMGNPTYNGEKLRFLVIPRFNTDLQKLFESNGKKFPAGTVFRVALQVLDVLEYIHSQGFAHADIKAANLMIGNKDPNQVYLIDYGLAFRFNVEGKHKEYKEDPKKAHDGTTEYASRDAHKGVWPSARGDLETLGYCMWQWLAGKLPWEKDINNKPLVADQKIRYMKNVDSQVAPLIKDQASSKGLCKFLTAVTKLDYDETPKYDDLRQLFRSTLTSLKCKLSDKLDFGSSPSDAGLLSPVRRSGRSSKVQTAVKPRQSISALLKSPIPKAKTQRPVEANVLKSPARATGRERMFSPSPPPRSKVTKAKDEVVNGKATKKVVNAVTSTNHDAGTADANSRKRKRDEQGGDSSPKKTKTAAAATNRTPVLSRSPSARAAHMPTKLRRKKLTTVRVSSSTQTTPGLRTRSRTQGGL